MFAGASARLEIPLSERWSLLSPHRRVQFPILPCVIDAYDDAGASVARSGVKAASGLVREDVPLKDWAVLIEDTGGLVYPKFACGSPEEVAVAAAYLLQATPILPAAVAKVAATSVIEHIRWAPRHSIPLHGVSAAAIEALANIKLSSQEESTIDWREGVVKVAALGDLLTHGKQFLSRVGTSAAKHINNFGDAVGGTLNRAASGLRGAGRGAASTMRSGLPGVSTLQPAAGAVPQQVMRPSVQSWAQEPLDLPVRPRQLGPAGGKPGLSDADFYAKYPALRPTYRPHITAPPPLPEGHNLVMPEHIEAMRGMMSPETHASVVQALHREGAIGGWASQAPSTMNFGATSSLAAPTSPASAALRTPTATLAPAPAAAQARTSQLAGASAPVSVPGYAEAPTVMLRRPAPAAPQYTQPVAAPSQTMSFDW